MARRKEPADEELKRLVAESLKDLGEDGAAEVAERVMDVLRPVVGAAAERRRNESALRDAFKEGYLTGQNAGRWSRWHAIIWKHSELFKRMRAQEERTEGSVAAAAKYANFNF